MHYPSSHRRGFSLIDLIVLIAVLAILLALLLPAIQKVRESAGRTQSQNNMKQIGISIHVIHENFRRLPPAYDKFSGLKFQAPIHVYLLPYLEQQPLFAEFEKKNQAASEAGLAVFISPEDNSIMKRDGVQNYAANLRVFSDHGRKVAYDKDLEKLDGDHPCSVGLINGMPDGTSNTMMFTTKFGLCGEGGSRYAVAPSSKFAAFFGQNAAQEKPHPSSAKAAYQLQPDANGCRITPLLAQSFSKHGISVGMGDGSVRMVQAGLTPQTWNQAVHPADGTALGNDFNQ